MKHSSTGSLASRCWKPVADLKLSHGTESMKHQITAPRTAAMLILLMALAATTATANAQNRYRYGPVYYGYGPIVYGYYGTYGYGPRYYRYRRPSLSDPDSLPPGTGAWWRAMDRANRGGNPGGAGAR